MLRVIWTAPEKSNGEIIAYNIYLDDVKIETGMKFAGSYTIEDLQPFVKYMVQVRNVLEVGFRTMNSSEWPSLLP